MNSFSTSDVIAACHQYGPQLIVPDKLEPIKVMISIASVESSLGKDCGPRHEPAYEANGAVWAKVAMTPLLTEYPPVGNPPQSPAACSYGPWQMMFLNFQRCFTPQQLETNLTICATEFVRWFNHYVVGDKPQNLAEIGEIWNAGHITADPDYVNKLQKAYNEA